MKTWKLLLISLNFGNTISDAQKADFINLIREEYLMSPEFGSAPLPFKMRIVLKSDAPLYFPPRRLSASEKSEVQPQINKLIDEGTIRRSSWANMNI